MRFNPPLAQHATALPRAAANKYTVISQTSSGHGKKDILVLEVDAKGKPPPPNTNGPWSGMDLVTVGP